MKITIDLDKLLEEGKITREEYNKFSQFAAHSTATLAFNILIGFGVIAVSGATLALFPIPLTAITLGLMIAAAGIALVVLAGLVISWLVRIGEKRHQVRGLRVRFGTESVTAHKQNGGDAGLMMRGKGKRAGQMDLRLLTPEERERF